MINIYNNVTIPLTQCVINGIQFPKIRLFLDGDIEAIPLSSNVLSQLDDIRVDTDNLYTLDDGTYIEIQYEVHMGIGKAYIVTQPHDITKRQYMFDASKISLEEHRFIISAQELTGFFWFTSDIRDILSASDFYEIEHSIDRSINSDFKEIVTTPFTVAKITHVFIFKQDKVDIVGHIGITPSGNMIVGTRQHTVLLPSNIDKIMVKDTSHKLLNMQNNDIISITEYEKIDRNCVLLTAQEAEAIQNIMSTMNAIESIKPILSKLLSKR